jgi:molybdenum cofactor cytidylyltransferase
MRFGEIPVRDAEGAILAHSLKLGATVFKKGRVLSASDVEALTASGLTHIVAARLDPGDLREDEAADRVAAVVAGANVAASPAFTGRANLFAEARGLLVFDRDRLDRLNLVDEAVTLGTLPPFAIVEPRQMVATVKIIPFAVPEEAVARAAAKAASCCGSQRSRRFGSR